MHSGDDKKVPHRYPNRPPREVNTENKKLDTSLVAAIDVAAMIFGMTTFPMAAITAACFIWAVKSVKSDN